MKKYLLLLSLIAVLSSCDYYGTYYYYVENRLESDTVVVTTHFRGYRYPTELTDSVFVLLPQERKLIRLLPTGPSGRHEHPFDIMAYTCDIGQFYVFVNGIKLERNFCEREYWEFTTEPLKGVYLLVIDENLLRSD